MGAHIIASLSSEHRQTILGLQLLSHGATANLSPMSGRGGDNDAALPAGELRPPHERYLELLARPGADVEAIMERARQELEDWKRRPLVPIRTETLEELKVRIVECDGWETRDVALAMRCTESLVRIARVEADRDPKWGRKLEAPLPEEPRERARVLVGLGFTYRQVEALCGVPITTIWRAAHA
jgi:hypothetical protein